MALLDTSETLEKVAKIGPVKGLKVNFSKNLARSLRPITENLNSKVLGSSLGLP